MIRHAAPVIAVLLAAGALPAEPAGCLAIRVVDAETSRGIPLARAVTLNGIARFTDSAGLIAFQEPGLMGRDVFFDVSSPGYEMPADGFGVRGRTLRTTPGTTATVALRRVLPARRLYRITGAGIYRDSALLGAPVPAGIDPFEQCGILGMDSALETLHRGRLFWIWGDTTNARYPLAANFKCTGAVSDLPTSGGLDPDTGIALRVFQRDGFPRPMVPLPGANPYWLGSLVSLRDAAGAEHLVAQASRIKPPMTTEERFWVELDETTNEFRRMAGDDPQVFRLQPDGAPGGHVVRCSDRGTSWILFTGELRLVRVPDRYEALRDPALRESWTCLVSGSRWKGAASRLDRAPSGRLRWGWKPRTDAVGAADLDILLRAGAIRPSDCWVRLSDARTGRRVRCHSGSLAWNPWRGAWTMIFGEIGGRESLLGEIWYAEAPAPTGPWREARQVATHPRMSFYNPIQHPAFAKDGGRVIYFEGTHVTTFSGNPVPVPRYEYNQIMYRLDLDDPRLGLEAPVRRTKPPDSARGLNRIPAS